MTTPKARFEIAADDKTAAAFKSALSQGKRFSGEMKSVLSTAFVGISVAGLTSAIASAIEYGDAIGNAAKKSGIAASTFSELAHAANMSDVSLDSLSTAVKKMQVNLAAGSDEFDKLGLTMQRLRGMSPDKQFELIAQRISEIQDPAERTAAAVAIFGNAGADLLRMFEQGAAGIRAACEEAKKLGIAMSDEVVKTLQEGDDAIKRLHASWEAFKRSAAVTTVKGLQAADIFDKNEIGELNDTLDALRLQQVQLAQSTFYFTDEGKKRYAELGEQIKKTLADIERARTGAGTGTRGGGGRNGPSSAELAYRKKIADEMEREQKAAEEYARVMEQLQEVQISSKKIADDNPWPQYYEDSAAAANDAVLDMQELANTNAEWANSIAEQTTDAMVSSYQKNVDAVAETSEFAKEAARSMYSAFSDAFYNLGADSNTFAEDILNAFKRILANAATTELFEMLASLGDSMSSDGSSSTSSAIGDLISAIFTANAKGNAYGRSGLITAFANGGVVSGATPFAFAGGMGVMGEAGDEAIMPLSRGSDGKLGVKAQGSGGVTNISVPINIDARGATQDAVKLLPQVAQRASDDAVARILDMKRRGKL